MTEHISKVSPSPGLVGQDTGRVPQRQSPPGFQSTSPQSFFDYGSATGRASSNVSHERKFPDFRNGPNGPLHRHEGAPSYRQWHPVSRKHRDTNGNDISQKVHLANGCGKDGMGGDAASREASQADKIPHNEVQAGGVLGFVQRLSNLGVGNIASGLLDTLNWTERFLTSALSGPMSVFGSIAGGAFFASMNGFSRRLEERARRSEANFMANPGAMAGTITGGVELEIDKGMCDAAMKVNDTIGNAIGLHIGSDDEFDISKLGKKDIDNLKSKVDEGLKEAQDALALDASGERLSARDYAMYSEMLKEYSDVKVQMGEREKQIAADERQVSRNIREENRRKAEFEREEKKRQKQAEKESKALVFKEGSFVLGAAGWEGYGTLADKTFSEFGSPTDDHGIPDSVKGISVASTKLSEYLMRVRTMPETTAEESEYKRRNETALVNALRAIDVKEGYLKTKKDLQRNGYDCNSPQARALSDAYDRAIKEFEFKGVEFDDRGVAVSGNDDIRDAGSSYEADGSAYRDYEKVKDMCDDLVVRMGGHAQGPAGRVKEADEVFEGHASQAARDIRQSIGATGRLDANSLPSTEKGVRKYIRENHGRTLELAKLLSDVDTAIHAGDDAEVDRLIKDTKDRRLIKDMDYSYNTPAERAEVIENLRKRNRSAIIGLKMALAKRDMIDAHANIEKDRILTRDRKNELKAKVSRNYSDRIKDASIGTYEVMRDENGRIIRDPTSNKPIVDVKPPVDLAMSDNDYEAALKDDELKEYYPNEDTKARRDLDDIQLHEVMTDYWPLHEAEFILNKCRVNTIESDGMPGSLGKLKSMREECITAMMALDNREGYSSEDEGTFNYSRRRMEVSVLATKCSAKIMKREAYDNMMKYVKRAKPQTVYSYDNDNGDTVYTTRSTRIDSDGEEVDNDVYGSGAPMYVMADGNGTIRTDNGTPLVYTSREELGSALNKRFQSNVCDINDTIQSGLSIPRMDSNSFERNNNGDIVGLNQIGALEDKGMFTDDGYDVLDTYREGVVNFSNYIGSPTIDVLLDYSHNTKDGTPMSAGGRTQSFGSPQSERLILQDNGFIKCFRAACEMDSIDFIIERARALGGLSERFGVPVGRNAQTAIRKCAKSYLARIDELVRKGLMSSADRTSDGHYVRMLGYLRATALCAAVEPSKRV